MNKSLLTLALLSLSGLAQALSGQITDESGNPIPDATLKLIGTSTVINTDKHGKFAMPVDNADEIHIEAPGYSHKVLHLHGEHDKQITVVLSRTMLEQVDVIGLPLHASTIESAQPIAVVTGEELRNKQASTLGETLKHEIGVHSTYFGPVASSPIIRGLDGPRVLVTQNNLDVSDASRVGTDHTVATEASTAKQVEILRGPSTLFFGSGAIGGVVNIVDDRVPTDSEQKIAFSMQHNTIADEDEISAAYSSGNEYFAFHVDGFWRDGEDYSIPGEAVLEAGEDHEHEGEEHEGEEHEEEDHAEHHGGVLESSASESQGYNIGGSWLLDNGYIGVSYGRLERFNGVPGHSHEGEGTEEQVFSDLEQDRWQLISEFQIGGDFLDEIDARIGYTDYKHAEIHRVDDVSTVGTTFTNQTTQAKVDVQHQELGSWRGAFSIEGKFTDFEATGNEAFTPPSETTQYSFAVMEEKHADNVLWQFGARMEQVELKAKEAHTEHEHEGEEVEIEDQSFTPISLSLGAVWDFSPGYNMGIVLTHAQRAPSAAELFANGPHVSTNTYEIGAIYEIHEEDGEYHVEYHGDVQKEVSNNLDISFRKFEGDFGFVANVFYNQVSDFYFQSNTGLTSEDILGHEEEPAAEDEHHHEDILPVYIFEQADASFYGFEAEAAWQVTDIVTWTLWGDTTRGKLDDGGNLPRIPPKRLGNRFLFENGPWQTEINTSYYFEQSNVAENETSTDGYTMVDAQLTYLIETLDGDIRLFLKGTNLTNEEARVHSSFIKDQAPLPGRGWSLGVRASF